MKEPYVRKLDEFTKGIDSNVKVFLVDGAYIRKNIEIEFELGGHGYVYDFIPKDEIWIDNTVRGTEQKFTLLHELYERRLMEKGFGYDDECGEGSSHDMAAELEHTFRQDEAGLDETIEDLLTEE